MNKDFEQVVNIQIVQSSPEMVNAKIVTIIKNVTPIKFQLNFKTEFLLEKPDIHFILILISK